MKPPMIYSGVPVPQELLDLNAKRRKGQRSKRKEPNEWEVFASRLDIGDSFTVSYFDGQTVLGYMRKLGQRAISTCNERFGGCSRPGHSKLRIWRIQ